MTDQNQSFRDQVAADPATKQRWISESTAILAEIKKEHGVDLDPERLMASTAIKLRVLAGADLPWRKEIEALPEIARAIENKRLMKALSDQKDERHDAAMESIYGLKPEDRMSAARSMRGTAEHIRGSSTKRELSYEEKEAALKEIKRLPRHMQLAKARALGLE